MKPEETQQLNSAGSLEKTPPHQPVPPPFLVLTVQDFSSHRLVSLAICALTDPVLNHSLIWYPSSTTTNKEEEDKSLLPLFLSLSLSSYKGPFCMLQPNVSHFSWLPTVVFSQDYWLLLMYTTTNAYLLSRMRVCKQPLTCTHIHTHTHTHTRKKKHVKLCNLFASGRCNPSHIAPW